MTRRKRRRLLNTILTITTSVLVITPIYISVHGNTDDGVILKDAQIPAELATEDINRPCEYIEPSPADGGTLSHEVERFIRHINDIETECASVQLLGHPSKKRSEEPQDLRANSYVCLGGRHGLHRQDCLVYSFGIKHPWIQFSELVEEELGCNVYVFEPAVDFIDHYHSKKIRFFNARLSDFDRQAQYKVPGEEGWKYRKFSTIIMEKHFREKPIDVVRLDVTLDLWRGVSSMLSDGSLSSFAKQLTMEYNLANKNTTEVREMFGIAQWLKRQGFRLVHSQATKTSTTSYAATYVNDRIANSPSSNMLVRPEDATQILKVTGKSPNLSKRSTSAQTPKVTEHVPSLSKRTTLVPTPKVTGKVPPVSKRSASNKTPKVTEKAPTLRIRSVLVL